MVGGIMIKCANCPTDAVYTVADPGANPVSFCINCLPKWLRDRALLGHFPLQGAVKEEVVEEVKKTTKKKTAPAEEAPVDESN
jgi:hypothetical protein